MVHPRGGGVWLVGNRFQPKLIFPMIVKFRCFVLHFGCVCVLVVFGSKYFEGLGLELTLEHSGLGWGRGSGSRQGRGGWGQACGGAC